MKLLFIYPRRGSEDLTIFQSFKNIFLHKVVFAPGLTYNVLAALTPKDYSIHVINEEYQKIDFNEDCDLVGITATTPIVNRAYSIADKFRDNGKKVIIGGCHASALPNEAKQHANSVVVGNAEETWPMVIKDIEGGKLQPIYRQMGLIDSCHLPTPDRKRMKGSFFSDGIQTSWGCSTGCHYCAITNSTFGKHHVHRDISSIVRELEEIPQKFLRFYDPSLTSNPKYTKELFRSMIGLNKKFHCNGNIHVLGQDEELLALASEAGCLQWSVGLESISQNNLDSVGKLTNKVDDYANAIKKIHDHGMWVKGNFMFGFDNDYSDVFEKTKEKVQRLEVDIPCFYIVTPLPGTPLFAEFEQGGRILTRDWSLYDFGHVVFQPKNIPADILFEKTYEIYEDFYSPINKIRRTIGGVKTDVLSFAGTALENLYY
jgi:radical SAM superfamily enzyme YgiQ (UPF0313 family)